jgi:hypothetical protein
MGVVIVDHKLTKEDVKTALEDHVVYIKITIDIENEIVAIGGEYHTDAENILTEKFGSKNKNIWGGGYDTISKVFEFNAMINLKPNKGNGSMLIMDSDIRDKFLALAKKRLSDIDTLL